MASQLNPYLNFPGQARDALEFYAGILGGEPQVMTFGQFGDPDAPNANDVMHGYLGTDRGYALMISDGPPGEEITPGNAVALSLSGGGDDADDLRRYFAALADGGTVVTPLEKQMWGDEFGMLVDRFGIHWLVNISLG